jgi:hypothetical protein
MTSQAEKAISVADRVVSLSEDALRGLEFTIRSWPDEFKAIMWEAVADIASRRASKLRQGQHP